MIVKFTFDHLRGGHRDHLTKNRIEFSQCNIGFRCRPLDDTQRMNQWQRHALSTDFEILQRTLGLSAPVAVGRNINRSESICFGTSSGHFWSPADVDSEPSRAQRI